MYTFVDPVCLLVMMRECGRTGLQGGVVGEHRHATRRSWQRDAIGGEDVGCVRVGKAFGACTSRKLLVDSDPTNTQSGVTLRATLNPIPYTL